MTAIISKRGASWSNQTNPAWYRIRERDIQGSGADRTHWVVAERKRLTPASRLTTVNLRRNLEVSLKKEVVQNNEFK
jgi:hypothetical protein